MYLVACVLKRINDNPELSKHKKEMNDFHSNCKSFWVVAEQIRNTFDCRNEVFSRIHMLEPASVLGIQGKLQEKSLVSFVTFV